MSPYGKTIKNQGEKPLLFHLAHHRSAIHAALSQTCTAGVDLRDLGRSLMASFSKEVSHVNKLFFFFRLLFLCWKHDRVKQIMFWSPPLRVPRNYCTGGFVWNILPPTAGVSYIMKHFSNCLLGLKMNVLFFVVMVWQVLCNVTLQKHVSLSCKFFAFAKGRHISSSSNSSSVHQ